MRIIKLMLSVLLCAGFVAPHLANAADNASVHAILVIASNAKAPADPRLAPYEAELQRNVPESSFRLAGEGSASVSGNGRATIGLGGGHKVELQGEPGGGAGVKLKVDWLNGRNTVISGSFTLERGIPMMLGRRPSGDGEVPIVLLIAN